MTNVTLQVEPGTNITTLTAVGRVTASGLRTALRQFYAQSPTLHVLCDFSHGDLGELSVQEVRELVMFAEGWAKVRPGGRTAIAATGDLEYEIARMYAVLAELRQHPITIQAFRSREEALRWLQQAL